MENLSESERTQKSTEEVFDEYDEYDEDENIIWSPIDGNMARFKKENWLAQVHILVFMISMI